MSRWIRLTAVGLVLGIAACGENSSDSLLAPPTPVVDSAPIVGGNDSSSDSTAITRSGPIVGGN